MGDFNFGEQAGSMDNFLAQATETGRKTNAYNALAKIYGPIAGDPQAAINSANAQTATVQAPLVQAAARAKAAALDTALQDFGPSAGNPEAQQQNQTNQAEQSQNLRQAQFRGIQMLKGSIPEGSDSVDPATFDRVVGANAKTLGLTDPDQLQAFRSAVTAPGGAQHLDTIGQALLAPMKVTGATQYGVGADGQPVAIVRDQYGNIVQQNMGGTRVVPQQRADQGAAALPIKQQQANAATANAATNAKKIPILQQNANTAAYSANTRSNNSAFGNPGGQAGGTATVNTHVGNSDGTATTPAFDKLAPVGSKARATAIGTATQIVNQDTQLQNTNNVISAVEKQITPYTSGTGSFLKDLPGSAQANLKANLQSLKASGQMAWIASLKNSAGQTGIGRVLQSEAKNAETLFGNMEQDQTAPQLALHLRLFKQTVNQLHNTAQQSFKAQWGQDPYALVGAQPGKGGAGGADKLPADLAAVYSRYGVTK